MQIKIDGLEFGYSSTPVLNDITLDLSGPKFVSIMGPNGVGKSTLIHCINKILTPTSGTVMLDGKDVKGTRREDGQNIIYDFPGSGTLSIALRPDGKVQFGAELI